MMRKDFNKASGAQKPKNLTLRLSPEERTQLEREAAGMGLSSYVRQKVFDDAATPRRTRGKFPVKDHVALAQVLGRLGRSELARAIGGLLLAVEDQRLHLSDDQDRLLRSISDDVTFIRTNLLKALGQKATEPSPIADATGD